MVNAGVMLLPGIFVGLFPAPDNDSKGHDGGAVGFVDTALTAGQSASPGSGDADCPAVRAVPGTALPAPEEVPAGIGRGKRRALMLSL